jgi:hypothetical protein
MDRDPRWKDEIERQEAIVLEVLEDDSSEGLSLFELAQKIVQALWED